MTNSVKNVPKMKGSLPLRNSPLDREGLNISAHSSDGDSDWRFTLYVKVAYFIVIINKSRLLMKHTWNLPTFKRFQRVSFFKKIWWLTTTHYCHVCGLRGTYVNWYLYFNELVLQTKAGRRCNLQHQVYLCDYFAVAKSFDKFFSIKTLCSTNRLNW